jgi:hypothetical protein
MIDNEVLNMATAPRDLYLSATNAPMTMDTKAVANGGTV